MPHEVTAADVAWVKALAGSLCRARWPAADPEDVAGDGMLGLLDAARSYDGGVGTSFHQFARRRVVGAMVDGYRSWSRCRRVERPVVVSLSEVDADWPAGPDAALVLAGLRDSDRLVCELLSEGALKRDVATRLGVSGAALRRRMSRLRGVLSAT